MYGPPLPPEADADIVTKLPLQTLTSEAETVTGGFTNKVIVSVGETQPFASVKNTL